jgi:acyl-coenzyme A synthetase/AMP-(fatty) acid ligase
MRFTSRNMTGLVFLRLGLSSGVKHWATYQSDKAVIASGPRTVSFSELNLMADRVAAALTRQGLSPHDKIGLYALAPISVAAIAIAIARVGGEIVFLNALEPAAAQSACRESGCAAILVDDGDERCAAARVAGGPPILSLHELEREGGQHSPPSIRRGIDWGWGRFYSAWSDGTLRGAVRSDISFLMELLGWALELGIRRSSACYAGRSFSQVGGVAIPFTTLMVGATLIAPAQHTAEAYFSACANRRVDLACFFNDQIDAVLEAASDAPARGRAGAPDILVMGASHSADQVAAVRDKLGARLITVWANAAGIRTIARPDDAVRKPRSIGRQFITDSLCVADDSGTILPPGKVGRLASVADPHSRHRVASAPDARPGHLIVSNDRAYVDEDGYFFLQPS